MANTKKKKSTSKRKSTTTRKSSTTRKKTTTKTSGVSPTKKSTTTKKKTNTPKAKKSTASIEQALVETEITKKIDAVKVETELPKKKAQTREISKNKNVANKVVKEEKFTGVKTAQKQIKGKRKNKENLITLIKSHPFLQKINRLKRKIKIYGITSVIPKKYLIVSLFLLLFMIVIPIAVYFYQEPGVKIDLTSVQEDIDTLKTLSLNLDNIDDIVNNQNYFNSMKNYDRYDFDSVFKLNSDYVDDFVIKYNESKKQLLFIIKPTNNNYDNVISSINAFLKENKISVTPFDYDGYIIYIKSKSKESDTLVKSKIMQSTINVFDLLLDLKKDDISSTLKIPSNLYTEAVIKVARLKSDTTGYAIIKPSSLHAKNKIMSLMNDYYKSLEDKWKDDSDNLELIKNRYFEEYDGYLIYIVSNNNKLVMELIKSK